MDYLFGDVQIVTQYQKSVYQFVCLSSKWYLLLMPHSWSDRNLDEGRMQGHP